MKRQKMMAAADSKEQNLCKPLPSGTASRQWRSPCCPSFFLSIPRLAVLPLLLAILLLVSPLPGIGLRHDDARASGVPLLMPIKKKPPALDFLLEDLNGKVWQLADLKGKVVVINFWAISCPVCRVEMPTLEKLWRKFGKMDVQVLTIHVGHTEAEIRRFVEELDLKLPVLHDPSKKISRSWGVFNLPVTFVLDTEGKLAYIAFGGRNWLNPEIIRTIIALRPPL